MALDPQMQTVIDQFDGLGGRPVVTLTPAEARRQPTPAEAVRAVLWEEGSSLSPEPVGAVEELEIPTPDGLLGVRVYWPLGADPGPLPVLVYAHGGGWVLGDVDTYDATPRALTNRAGCIVVSVEYRRAPEHSFLAAQEDLLAATSWVMANIGELSGDPARVAVGGEGAGATMAVATCRSLKAPRARQPVFQLLVHPVTDLVRTDWASYREHRSASPLNTETVEWFADNVAASPSGRGDPRLSPAFATRSELSGLPPALIVTAEHDPLRDQGEAFGRLLLDAGVNATTVRIEGVTHDFLAMNPVVGQAQRAVSLSARHLREAFGLPGETAPTVPPDLAQMIAAQRAGILALLSQLEQGRGDHRQVIEQLVHALSDHAELEQLVPGGALTGHQSFVGLLAQEPADEDVEAGAAALRAAIADHVVDQERELAEMRCALGNDRMRELGRQGLEARRAASGGRRVTPVAAYAG